MRGKKLLAAFLVGVGLCFVPVSGYGEISRWIWEETAGKVPFTEFYFLEAKVNYMMRNPTNFLDVDFEYDPIGSWGRVMLKLPKEINTKGKICVQVRDNRGIFSYKSGIALLDEFKRQLEVIYSFISFIDYYKTQASGMDTDIAAVFYSKQGLHLGYFYQGEYHLWGK